jgi:hypothetical protein
MKKVIVLTEFADKDNFAKRYKVGEELTGFSEERLASLVERGIVGYEQEPIVSDIDMSGNYQKIVSQVKTFEDVEKLKQYLEVEKASEKPRASVVKAIEERLASLVEEN